MRVAVGPIMPGLCAVSVADRRVCRDRLVGFRAGVYGCFGRRGDALFELVDAVLTRSGPVHSLVELAEENVFRRGYGSLYDALAGGDVDVEGLAGLIAGSWDPVDAGPVKIAVDVSPWPRPDAPTSPGLCHCYTACRCDGVRKTIPGWPFTFAAGPEWGASSWTALLDARRVGPDDDATLVTVAQVAVVVARLTAAGTLVGRPGSVFVFDAGYDLTRISYRCDVENLGVQVLGRVRSDRVFYTTASPGRADGRPGRPRRHGERFALTAPGALPPADERLDARSPRYGQVTVSAWHGLHQKLDRQAGWAGFTGTLPIVAGTVIRIQVQHLPGDRPRRICGCGTPHPPPPGSTWTCSGRRICAVSTSNTRFGSSRPCSAGPCRRSEPRSRGNGGPG
jgi:hypothetical protein